jgi:hypothetical protein
LTYTKEIEMNILKKLAIINLFFCGIILLFSPNPQPYVNGLLFGSAISFLNFKLLARTLTQAVNLPQSRVMTFVMGKYMTRYIITAIVLTISIIGDKTLSGGEIEGNLSFFSTLLGFFLIKLIIHSTNILNIIKKGLKVDNTQ